MNGDHRRYNCIAILQNMLLSSVTALTVLFLLCAGIENQIDGAVLSAHRIREAQSCADTAAVLSARGEPAAEIIFTRQDRSLQERWAEPERRPVSRRAYRSSWILLPVPGAAAALLHFLKEYLRKRRESAGRSLRHIVCYIHSTDGKKRPLRHERYPVARQEHMCTWPSA